MVVLLGAWNDLRLAAGFGVCLFFLLSAFLITELLEKECLRTHTVQVRSFYIRRALRIWPLYFCFLGATALIGLFVPAYRVEPGRLLALILLSGNWYTAAKGSVGNIVGALWSISVEEQFYLAWPWLAKLSARKGLWLVSVLLVPCSWFAILHLSRTGAHRNLIVWFNSFVQFQFFGLGAVLALYLQGHAPGFSKRVRIGLLVAGLLAWYLAEAIFRIKDDDRLISANSSVLGYTLVAGGSVLFLLGFLGLPENLVPKPLAYLGKISYGLYVFHLLALLWAWTTGAHAFSSLFAFVPNGLTDLIFCVAGLMITVSLAMLSYRFLEKPFLRMKQRFAIVQP